MSFSGALLTLSADQWVGSNAFSPYFKAAFDTVEYDDGCWFDAATKRLVVPEGVSVVRVTASVVWETNAVGMRQIVIWKNGAFTTGLQPDNTRAVQATTTDHTAISHPIKVQAGDYFEVHPYYDTAGYTIRILKSTGTCFSIEALG